MDFIKKHLKVTGIILGVIFIIGISSLIPKKMGAYFSTSSAGYPSYSAIQPTITPATATTTGTNTLTNPSFETLSGSYPASWTSSTLSGTPTFSVTTTARTGSYAIQIMGSSTAIAAIGSLPVTGLVVSSSYLVSAYGRVPTSSDGMPTFVVFNDAWASSTQVWNVSTTAWVAFTTWNDLFLDAQSYFTMVASSTNYTLLSEVITIPASGSISVVAVNGPEGTTGKANVLMDDFALQTYAPATATSSSDVTLFTFNNPSDATEITVSPTSTVLKINTTGGTDKTWLWLNADGQLILPSLNGSYCAYLAVSATGIFTTNTSTCPTY
jgi:hypothetical protein